VNELTSQPTNQPTSQPSNKQTNKTKQSNQSINPINQSHPATAGPILSRRTISG
jgi:hypothetical protein